MKVAEHRFLPTPELARFPAEFQNIISEDADMVTRTQISLIVSGELFRPSIIDAPFSEIEEPGTIGRLGRYCGVPIPYGSATFTVPENEKEGIRYLHDLVFPLMAILRAGGATEFFIHITFHYDQQCSLGFDPEELRMLADFGCKMMMDCWKDSDDEANTG